jgi:hypothetical protein
MNIAWPSIRINYHDPMKDGLFADGIAPIVDAGLAMGQAQTFLERHWDGGPHVQIVFPAAAAEQVMSVLGAAAPALRRHLELTPSTRRLDVAEARRLHEGLAQIERSSRPFERLEADNSFCLATYRPTDFGHFPSQRALLAATRCACASTPLVLAVHAQTRAAVGARLSNVMSMLLTYAAGLGDLSRSYLFMRVYFEKVVAASGLDRTKFRSECDAAYAARKEALSAFLDAFETRRDAQALPWNETLRLSFSGWLESVADIAASAQADDERLTMAPEEAGRIAMAGQGQHPVGLDQSTFVRALGADEALWDAMRENRAMQRHMFIVNRIYRFLAVIGVTPRQKLMVFHLLARAVESHFGLDAHWPSGTAEHARALG